MQQRRGVPFHTVRDFTLGTILGAAVGSIAALLYAPASGEMTRRRLGRKVRELRRTAARRIGQTQRVLARKAEDVREAAAGWITEHMPHGNGRPHRALRHATAR